MNIFRGFFFTKELLEYAASEVAAGMASISVTSTMYK